jgi:hypothetical protein
MDLRGCVFREADLTEAVLTEARAEAVTFERANLSHARLDAAQLACADFSSANLLHCTLNQANLERALCIHASLREATLISARMAGADCAQAVFRGADLTDADLTHANLEHADLRETDCTRVQMDGAQLREAMVRDAVLEGVSFVGVDFSHAVDFSPRYQMIAFQQRKDAIEEEKRFLAREHEQLRRSESMHQEARQALERQERLLTLQRGQHEQLHAALRGSAPRIKALALLWGCLALVFMLTVGIMAGSVPKEQLNVLELGVVFGAVILLQGVFIVTAFSQAKTAHLLRLHLASLNDSE